MYLAKAHAELGQFDEAWRNVHEAITAIENSNENWVEADVNRIAGEIARKSEADALKAEKYSSSPSPLLVNNKPNPGNSAPP